MLAMPAATVLIWRAETFADSATLSSDCESFCAERAPDSIAASADDCTSAKARFAPSASASILMVTLLSAMSDFLFD